MKDKYKAFMVYSGQLSHHNTLKINEDMFEGEVLNNNGGRQNIFLSEGEYYVDNNLPDRRL
jgi:hypothetical protein